MKTIEDAVIDFNGIWPEQAKDSKWFIVLIKKLDGSHSELKLDKDKFESEAKRLGYINGYRWGVEYPTNGKRPELADDVAIELRCGTIYGKGKIGFYTDWNSTSSFKITDPRYKPADTSYLNEQPKDHIVESNEMVVNARPCWPPVAGMTVELWFGGQYVENVEFLCERGGNVIFWRYSNDSVDSAAMPTAELKPLRTEREKVIEAAVQVCTGVKIAKVSDGLTMNTLNKLYSAGMLVLPPKKSDTKD